VILWRFIVRYAAFYMLNAAHVCSNVEKCAEPSKLHSVEEIDRDVLLFLTRLRYFHVLSSVLPHFTCQTQLTSVLKSKQGQNRAICHLLENMFEICLLFLTRLRYLDILQNSDYFICQAKRTPVSTSRGGQVQAKCNIMKNLAEICCYSSPV
jgi:hypothetical protein